MIQEYTKMAILALAEVDMAMTNDERVGLAEYLSGEADRRPVRRTEAARRIGCHPNTIDLLIRKGELSAIRGPEGRSLGVSSGSLRRYLANQPK